MKTNVSYIRSTQRSSKCRIDQHLEISSRAGSKLTTIVQSLPRIHAETFNHKIQANNFSIIDYCSSIPNLPTLRLSPYFKTEAWLESPARRHPTLHIVIREECITLQPGYISMKSIFIAVQYNIIFVRFYILTNNYTWTFIKVNIGNWHFIIIIR